MEKHKDNNLIIGISSLFTAICTNTTIQAFDVVRIRQHIYQVLKNKPIEQLSENRKKSLEIFIKNRDKIKIKSIISIAKFVYQNEGGIKTFYKGIQYTIVLTSLFNLTMFISYENLKYFFRKRAFGDNYENEEELKKLIQKEQNQIQKDIQNDKKIPLFQKLNTLRNQDRVCIFFSSSIAQFLGYVVAQPFDYFKCNAQSSGNKYKMQNKGFNKLYGGFWANQYGALTFYSTFWPTVEEVKIYFKRNYQQSGFGVNCVAGGIGGILATLTSHPFDVLKLQKQLFSCENQKSNVQIAKEIIKQNGIGGLYVGIWPRLIKLFLYGSSMNAVYEFTFQTISQSSFFN